MRLGPTPDHRASALNRLMHLQYSARTGGRGSDARAKIDYRLNPKGSALAAAAVARATALAAEAIATCASKAMHVACRAKSC